MTEIEAERSPNHKRTKDSTAAMDTRKRSTHVPEEEMAVHEVLLAVRKHITALKREGSYTLEDIERVSEDVGRAIAALRDIRDQGRVYAPRNHIDDILDDVWVGLFTLWANVANIDQMLYPVLVKFVAIKRHLDELDRSGAFMEDDLLEIQEALTDLENRHVRDGKFFANPDKFPDPGNPPSGQSILFVTLNRCRREVHNLLVETDAIESPTLKALFEEVVKIEREIRDFQNHGYSVDQVRALQTRARAVDAQRVDGSFRDPDGSIPAGQARLVAVLERVLDDLHILLMAKEEVSGPLRPVYERLVEIKMQLEKLMRNKRWTVTYADLDPLRRNLLDIDSLRTADGKILPDEGRSEHVDIPTGQAVVHQVLARCYHLVETLTRTTEAIAPDLEDMYNQLVEARRGLLELTQKARSGESVAASEITLLQNELREVESHRHSDGTFHTQKLDEKSGRIPRGQAVISALVSECYDLMAEVRGSGKMAE